MFHTRLLVKCNPELAEILMAELTEANFDAFLETDSGFEAFTEGERYNKYLVEEVRKKYEPLGPLEFSFSRIEKRNWNEEWEKSFSPIIVEDTCVIRAAFHQVDKSYPVEIIITPKMSFGTGHHQTTYLMVKNMLHLDVAGKRVMDAGCGTAILSILASRLGAREVEAFDIDDWSVENGSENAEINNCANIRIQKGTISQVALTGKFDVILANINKNVLLDEMQAYSRYLKAGGLLLLSGFFTMDMEDLLQQARACNLMEVQRDDRDTWAALLLRLLPGS